MCEESHDIRLVTNGGVDMERCKVIILKSNLVPEKAVY
jgi:hypothetical protein